MNITGYIAIGVVFILLALGALYNCERKARLQAEKDLAVAIEVNKNNAAYIEQMNKFKEQTEQALKQYDESKKDLEQVLSAVNESTKKILATNEEFRKWFSSTVPADAIRLYNKTKRTGGTPGNNKSAAGAAINAN